MSDTDKVLGFFSVLVCIYALCEDSRFARWVWRNTWGRIASAMADRRDRVNRGAPAPGWKNFRVGR